jgi:hypothetical protein
MNGFSIGTIFRDNCNTLVIASGSNVFDLEELRFWRRPFAVRL